MKLLKNSACISQHHVPVFTFPRSTLKQKLKWWHCLCKKLSPKAVKNLSFVSQMEFFCFSSDLHLFCWFLHGHVCAYYTYIHMAEPLENLSPYSLVI